jgi:hypothetical protein
MLKIRNEEGVILGGIEALLVTTSKIIVKFADPDKEPVEFLIANGDITLSNEIQEC